jgi:hypothetical protein
MSRTDDRGPPVRIDDRGLPVRTIFKLKHFRLTKISVSLISVFFLSTTCCLATECEPDLKSISWNKNRPSSQNLNITGDCIVKFIDQLLLSNFEILSDGFGEYKWLDVNNDGTPELFITTTQEEIFSMIYGFS